MKLTTSWRVIEQHICKTVGTSFNLHKLNSVSGGSINHCYHAQADNQEFFVKLNSPDRLAMFETEAAGLQELEKISELRIPHVICLGQTESHSYLVLEWLHLLSANSRCDQSLGEQLALLHSIEQPYFGWQSDNFIGSTPQANQLCDDWIEFFSEYRLGFQLELAANNGASRQLLEKGERLKNNLLLFFTDYEAKSSLLHGDLWGGNYAMDGSGQPVIFDPACYYGDREADIAMTELFGGFGPDFFTAYQQTLKLDTGYQLRKKLYLVYHILNHFNLFGGGYAGQASSLMDDLLSNVD
jgi:fructosamine-3-kinase